MTDFHTQALQLASQNWDMVIEPDTLSNGQHVYVARNPELPGCMTQVNDISEAFAMLKDARILYLASLLEDGQPIPKTRADVVYWRVTL